MTLPTNFNKKWEQHCLDVFLGRDAMESYRSAKVKTPIRVVLRLMGSLLPKNIQRTLMGTSQANDIANSKYHHI